MRSWCWVLACLIALAGCQRSKRFDEDGGEDPGTDPGTDLVGDVEPDLEDDPEDAADPPEDVAGEPDLVEDPGPDPVTEVTDPVVDVIEEDGGPVPGDTCDDAIDITSSSSWSGDLGHYGDLWTGGSSCAYGSGPEAWFSATVADGHVLRVEETSGTNVNLHVILSCPSTTCASSTANPERIAYLNDTGSDVVVYVVVEATSSWGGPVTLSITNSAAPSGVNCLDAIDVSSVTSWSGSFSDYFDFWHGGSGCGYAAGAEIWFVATVPSGNLFKVSETSSSNVTLQLISTCPSTTCFASETSPEEISYLNTTGSPMTLYLVVESYSSASTGSVDIDISNTPAPEGSTCNAAVDMTSRTTWSGTYAPYGNLWGGSSGCGYASGPEIWFTAQVDDGHLFRLDETTSTNTTLQLLTTCPSTSCAASSSTWEVITYHNLSGSTVSVFVAVESYAATSTSAVDVVVSNVAAPGGLTCDTAVDVTSLAVWTGDFSSYADGWTGGSGCTYASGAEVWFQALVPAGHTITIQETSGTNVVIHYLGTCSTSACLDSVDYPEIISVTNTTGSPVTMYFALERYSGMSGAISLDIDIVP
jgi:hypothetical protein